MKIFKELKIFFIINFVVVILVLLGEYVNSTKIIKEVGEKTNLNYTNKIIDLSNGTFNGLEQLVEEFSRDENIEKLLMSDDNYKNKEDQILANLKYAKGLITATSFAESIDIVDMKTNQMYSSKGYHKTLDIKKRSWYKEVYEKNIKEKKTVLTQLHKDYFNNRYTVSLVSFIKNNKNEVIGCVILNAYMDTFTKYMSELYGNNGAVKIYVKIKDNNFYEYSNGVQTLSEIEDKKDIYIVKKNNLLFVFNEKLNPINKIISKINILNLSIIIVFIVLIITSFIVVKRKVFSSLYNNVLKLKGILKQMNNYNEKEFDKKEEFEQLDFIVNKFEDVINEKAKEYMLYDDLTGVLNRKGLLERYKKEYSERSKFAVIFVDLNNFKSINDVYGHTIGDEYLKEFAKKAAKAIEKRGKVARISGDEFIFLIDNYISKEELNYYFKQNIINLFKKEKLTEYKLNVNFAAGVAIYPEDASDLNDLIKKSDHMMYYNKRNKKSNNIDFFDDGVFKKLKEFEDISVNIGLAISRGELSLKYQPISNNSKGVVKAEALLRWNSKELGAISPDKFIKVAEKNGSIVQIGYWVFNKVCEDVARLKINGVGNLIINVNVSTVQLLDSEFAKNIVKILERNKVSGSEICIEITESAVIEEEEMLLKNIEVLRREGITLSLDDFGTGYTSFEYLEKFKGESLKIDKTILDNANNNNYRVINSIREIGEELNYRVIIEGVETKEQFEKLKCIGCKYYQGYYFSKPIDFEELKNLLKKGI